MKALSRTLLCLSLYLPASLMADTTGYEVELIVFEDARSRYIQSEDWSFNDMLNNTLQEKKPAKKTKKDPEYAQLDWEAAKLAPQHKRLANNSNFKVLLTKRWKQTGLDRKSAFNININTNALDPEVTESNSLETEPSSYITGDVKLVMSRYLHFQVNLEYYIPQLADDSSPAYKSFPIVSERRMKSREVHYIDHPLVGVVVLATPYKIKEDTPDTKPTGYKTL